MMFSLQSLTLYFVLYMQSIRFTMIDLFCKIYLLSRCVIVYIDAMEMII
jgi:hypothetical protein